MNSFVYSLCEGMFSFLRILRDGIAFPFPEDLPNPGIEHASPALLADSLPYLSIGISEEGGMKT